MLGAGRLIHLKGTQWFGWIPDVNAEEQICFLLLSGNTNEKINSDHFPLLKTEAGPSVLLHQRSRADPAQQQGLLGALGSLVIGHFFANVLLWRFALLTPWALLAVGSCFESLTPAGWSKHLPSIQTQLLLGPELHQKEACPQLNLMLLHLGGGVEKEH